MHIRPVCMTLVLTLLLGGCGGTYNYENTGSTEAVNNNTEAKDNKAEAKDNGAEAEANNKGITAGGYPWIDSDIKENVLNAEKPDIKDDYNLAVNNEWLREAELREGYTYESPFVEASYDTAERVQALLEDDSLTGHDAELVKELYNTVMDWDRRNELGVGPVADTVGEIMSIADMEEMTSFICDFDRSNCVDTFISLGNNIDLNDPERYIVRINNDGLLLEDPAEYVEFTDVGSRAYEAKKALFITVAARLGLKPEAGEEMFNSVLSLEEHIASVSLSSEDKLHADYYERMNNVYSETEIRSFARSFPLYELIGGQGYADAGEYVISEPEVIKKLDELYIPENIGVLKNYMVVHYLIYMADKLDRECYEAAVEKNNILSGAAGSLSDEDAAYNAVLKYLPEPLENVYLNRYDCEEARKEITGICREVIDTYREMLRQEDWISEAAVDKAVDKLDSMSIKAVYPDKRQDYSTLSLEGLDYVACVKEINRFRNELDRRRTGGRADRELWRNRIFNANAYYEPQENSINIGAGILGDEIYHDGMSRAEALGGIGCIIGHEISHAFDKTGSGFDGSSRLMDWWEEEDRKAFDARTDKLTSYYDGITAFMGYNVRGEGVRDEATADLAGMKAVLRIAEKEEGFDYDTFFRQYAVVWKQISTYEREVYRLTRSEYPLNYLRVNAVVQQFDEFYDTYGVKEGDGMYLSPEDRVSVW